MLQDVLHRSWYGSVTEHGRLETGSHWEGSKLAHNSTFWHYVDTVERSEYAPTSSGLSNNSRANSGRLEVEKENRGTSDFAKRAMDGTWLRSQSSVESRRLCCSPHVQTSREHVSTAERSHWLSHSWPALPPLLSEREQRLTSLSPSSSPSTRAAHRSEPYDPYLPAAGSAPNPGTSKTQAIQAQIDETVVVMVSCCVSRTTTGRGD